MSERGWMIERGVQGSAVIVYWTGRSPDQWSAAHSEGIRFARQADAYKVLHRIAKEHDRERDPMWVRFFYDIKEHVWG